MEKKTLLLKMGESFRVFVADSCGIDHFCGSYLNLDEQPVQINITEFSNELIVNMRTKDGLVQFFGTKYVVEPK